MSWGNSGGNGWGAGNDNPPVSSWDGGNNSGGGFDTAAPSADFGGGDFGSANFGGDNNGDANGDGENGGGAGDGRCYNCGETGYVAFDFRPRRTVPADS